MARLSGKAGDIQHPGTAHATGHTDFHPAPACAHAESDYSSTQTDTGANGCIHSNSKTHSDANSETHRYAKGNTTPISATYSISQRERSASAADQASEERYAFSNAIAVTENLLKIGHRRFFLVRVHHTG
jgi:hypothetical protein